jgi:hypothetical protein
VPLEPTENGIVIDLSAVRIATPTLALRLAASQAVHIAAEKPFRIDAPRDRGARDYLARAGLTELMGLKPVAQTADVLMPVTRIHRSRNVEHAGEELGKAAATLPKGLAKANDALVLALSELGGNACSHGHSEHGAFVLAQKLGSSHLVLAVGDLGVGIPSHLGDALHTNGATGEAKLIAKALEPGVTGVRNGRPHENHGNGLPNLLETIRGLGMPVAALSIWSGVGRIDVPVRSRPTPRDVSSSTRGTWTEVVLASSETGSTK